MNDEAACPHTETCALYPLLRLTLGEWRTRFCLVRDFEGCARFVLASRAQPVPLDLLPNGKTLSSWPPSNVSEL